MFRIQGAGDAGGTAVTYDSTILMGVNYCTDLGDCTYVMTIGFNGGGIGAVESAVMRIQGEWSRCCHMHGVERSSILLTCYVNGDVVGVWSYAFGRVR